MWHRWQSSHKRFSISGNHPTEDLTLMAKRFGETGKTVLETSRKPALNSKNLAKFLLALDATTPIVMVVPLPEEGENLPQFARKNKILRVQPV
jgi:hypothetical protein